MKVPKDWVKFREDLERNTDKNMLASIYKEWIKNGSELFENILKAEKEKENGKHGYYRVHYNDINNNN